MFLLDGIRDQTGAGGMAIIIATARVMPVICIRKIIENLN
jgi:hypothetical protein